MLDVSIEELSLYVADAGQGSVDVLKLSTSKSRQGLRPAGQILKLKVGLKGNGLDGLKNVKASGVPVKKIKSLPGEIQILLTELLCSTRMTQSQL